MSVLSKNIHPMHSKTIEIDKNHHKNHKKVVLWPFLAKKLTNCTFSIIFKHKMTSIDVKMRVLSKIIHPMHLKTIKIDKNHHKNHKNWYCVSLKAQKVIFYAKMGKNDKKRQYV